MKFKFVVATFALNCALNVNSFDIVEKCKIGDEECIIRVAHELITNFKLGTPEISLPSIDPMALERLRIIQNMNSVNIDGGITNATILGISKGKFSKFLINPNGNLEFKFMIPLAIVEGPYDIAGQVLKLKLKGNGHAKATFKNFEMHVKCQLEKFIKEEDGKTYFNGTKAWMTFTFTGGSVHLSHLGSIANSFMNWSFAVLLNAVKETLCVPYSKFYVGKINQVLNAIPIDELFLE